ncbi:piggyBac transposable element-derived protein 4-like [Vespula maculifrons]|uniref:PiggyBac transposable element-derived protein 4-like n=1 Tax=Vespula maculifrons TaxID=7453 RepID=A0ABD2ASL5_VESMC
MSIQCKCYIEKTQLVCVCSIGFILKAIVTLNSSYILDTSYRLDKWSKTNPNEIKRFFGRIIWIELVRLSKIHSKHEENDPNNRLSKIIRIIDINSNLKKYYNLNEPLAPFHIIKLR